MEKKRAKAGWGLRYTKSSGRHLWTVYKRNNVQQLKKSFCVKKEVQCRHAQSKPHLHKCPLFSYFIEFPPNKMKLKYRILEAQIHFRLGYVKMLQQKVASQKFYCLIYRCCYTFQIDEFLQQTVSDVVNFLQQTKESVANLFIFC